jgi:LPPG:FO 2-phospho-L-lactate transferase
VRVTVLCGGVGAARYLTGLLAVVEPASVTAVVNVGDDLVLHGLHISPDVDTLVYTLAGAGNPETGWGLAGETWQAMTSLGRYGGPTWFSLGDRDLGTHLYRTGRLAGGATLSAVTAEIADAWGLGLHLVPVTDDRLRTMVTVIDEADPAQPAPGDGTRELSFQEYFVGLRHSVPVSAIRFAGAGTARPAPGVLAAIGAADVVVVAPSNPVVSIAPVLAVPGVREAVVAARDRVVAVSPIVAGAALKGPADRLLRELGHGASVGGVAGLYADFAATLVIDEADAALASTVEAAGMRAEVTATVMSTPGVAAALATATLRVVTGS